MIDKNGDERIVKVTCSEDFNRLMEAYSQMGWDYYHNEDRLHQYLTRGFRFNKNKGWSRLGYFTKRCTIISVNKAIQLINNYLYLK